MLCLGTPIVARCAQTLGAAICTLVLLFFSPGSRGATVDLTISSKLTATADYHEGKRSKPAVMVVHGFLQTREFPTIARLAQGLAEAGYSVLAPTLTLGVPRRGQSLSCEAIHAHSFEGDVAELGRWAAWLNGRGHRQIIMVGHSFGSLQSLAHAAAPSPGVSKVIAVSLVDTHEVSNRTSLKTLQEARKRADEFVTVLHDTDAERAANVAQRCITEVSRYNFAKLGIKEPVQISAGLACWQGKDPETLFILHKQADLAMYHAKKPGHSKLAVYNEEIAGGSQALVSSRETRAVFEAIETRESIRMHYQRVVALPGIDTSYYEALARIETREGLILPLDIFAVVEARRLEVEFDLAVIEAVKRDLEREVLPIGSGVSINISGPAIVTRSVIEHLLELAAFKDNYRLGIEITETALITQLSHAAANLEELRTRGFKVALDDFGSGYSPLRYLSSMPIDSVKFDIALIHSLQRADRQSLIVGKLAQLISDSGYELVAEGIETSSLLETVIGLGFTHAQGYYLGKPQPPGKLLNHSLQLTTSG